jgi:hypothetical protein
VRKIPIKYATIIPDENSHGHVLGKPLSEGFVRDMNDGMWETASETKIDALVDKNLAGAEALRALGVRNFREGTGSDYSSAVDLAIRRAGDGEFATA